MLNEFIKRETQQQILIDTADFHPVRYGEKSGAWSPVCVAVHCFRRCITL